MATRIVNLICSLPGALAMLLLACATTLAATDGQSGKRVALVIGNSHYSFAVELKNPVNDAHLMSKTLQGVGFEVVEGFDLDKAGMLAALDRFTEAAYDADLAVIYYAGHGLQVEGRNYVVPVDAQLEKAAQLQTRTIPMETLLASLPADPAVNIIILDACRDNPLARSLAAAMPRSRSTAVGTGLAAVQATASGSGSGGLLIAYATDPGAVAYDGNDANSPYTTALARHIAEQGVEIQSALTRVRAEVSQKTNGAQRPWHNASLSREIFLGGTAPAAPAPAQPAEPAPVVAAPAPVAPAEISVLEQTIWEEASRRDSYEHYAYYLEKYPNGKFAELAKLNISILERTRAQAGGPVVAAAPAPVVREVVVPPAPASVVAAPAPAPLPAPPPAQASVPEPAAVAAPSQPIEPAAQVAVAEPTPATAAPKPQVAAPAVEAPSTPATPADQGATALVLGEPAPASVPVAPEIGTELTEAQLNLDSDALADLQRRLNAMGYQVGRPDGKLGAKSRTAIATWQGANGFEASGYLTLGQQRLLVRQSDPLVATLRPDNPEPSQPEVQRPKSGKQSRQDTKPPAPKQAVQPSAPRAAQKVDPCPPGSIYRACAENGPAKPVVRKSSTKSWLPSVIKPKTSKKTKKDQNECLTDRQGRPGQSVCF
jgi:uncharacterized caspase-like protein/peptidoglycan hydrolase-like protein with peptidoglycan-binding domain